MKHTPGPWRVRQDDAMIGRYIILNDMTEHDDAANACLIAAAPEMYEALKELARLVHQNNALQHAGLGVSSKAWGEMYRATNKAKAVIAKAERS